MKKKSNNALIGSGVLTAIAASLCCITPFLALIAGTSGIASTFSWIEPFRPYLIGFTILVIGFAWYQKLKSKPADEIQCDCEEDNKVSFWQSKKFLGIVTVFAALMLAFPYYSDSLYSNNKKEVMIVNAQDIQTLQMDIEGMTCASCNKHVTHAAEELDGVIEAKADYKTGKAEVKFDKTKTSKVTIVKSINKTAYTVIEDKK